MGLLVLLLWPAAAWAQTPPPPAPGAGGEIVEYYATDALGSIRVVFTAAGAEVARADYLPFGERFTATGPLPPQQFTGQQRDPEAQLDHFNARSYQPTTGRFTGIDPVYAGLFDPQQWNRYAYARTNPLRFVDPTGQQIVPCPPGKPEGTICMTIIGLLPGGGGSTQPEYPDRILPPAWYRKPHFTGEPQGPTGPGDSESPTVPSPPTPPGPVPPPEPDPDPEDDTGKQPCRPFAENWRFAVIETNRHIPGNFAPTGLVGALNLVSGGPVQRFFGAPTIMQAGRALVTGTALVTAGVPWTPAAGLVAAAGTTLTVASFGAIAFEGGVALGAAIHAGYQGYNCR